MNFLSTVKHTPTFTVVEMKRPVSIDRGFSSVATRIVVGGDTLLDLSSFVSVGVVSYPMYDPNRIIVH